MDQVSEQDLRSLLKFNHQQIRMALDKLGQDVLRELATNAYLQDLPEDEIVETEGVVGEKVGYLLKGALAMIKHAQDGNAHIVGLLLPTDLFGRLTQDATPHRLVAVAPSRILYFDRADFDTMLLAHPELERMFLISVLDDLDAARDWILLLSGTSTVDRVAAFLVMLAQRPDVQRFPTSPLRRTVRLPINRKHLAGALAIRPESLSRALHKLADQGLIRIIDPANFEIMDLDALCDASSKDAVPSGMGSIRKSS